MQLYGENNVVVTTLNLKEKYKNYKDVNEKIKRDMDRNYLSKTDT